MKSLKLFKRFYSSSRIVINKCDLKMEEKLKNIFYASVNAVKPSELITKKKLIRLDIKNDRKVLSIQNGKVEKEFDVTEKKIHMVGFGKGVLAIAAEIEIILGENLESGILSVPIAAQKYQQILNKSKIKVIEGAAGNLPDENSLKAAEEIKSKVVGLSSEDILLVLITGGGSALLPLPIAPITLAEKSSLIRQLSRAGATIEELNTIRIAISQVKGGKLAAMGKNVHRIISIIISDVINDPLDIIASGPTIQFKNPPVSACEILEKFNVFDSLPSSIRDVLCIQNASQPIKNSDVFLIGNNRLAIDAAMSAAKSFGLIPVFLSAEVQGNVQAVSQAFFDLAFAVKNFSNHEEFLSTIEKISPILSGQPNLANDLVASLEAANSSLAGICIICGGETTVTVTGDGLGGRNQELALRFTKLCHDANTSSSDDLWLLSAGSDGFDGNNEAAGALGGSKILSDLIKIENKDEVSRIMQDFIFRNDSHRFFKNFLSDYAGDDYLITTGHTGTNVMDIMLLVVTPNKIKQDC